MFSLFRSKTSSPPPAARLELISVHIPKTAGTSFRNILKDIYGDQSVIRLDISERDGTLVNEQPYDQKDLPRGTKVIHGHFSPRLLRQSFDLAPEVPMITWLRHPVDRVVSNYYYLAKRLREELDEEAKGLDILRKMQCSLMEYARRDINRNRQHRFLDGVQLADLAFVGIQEQYSEDLSRLAQKIGWDSYEELRHNVTGSRYEAPSAAEKAEIAQLNSLDMDLYQQALEMRAGQ